MRKAFSWSPARYSLILELKSSISRGLLWTCNFWAVLGILSQTIREESLLLTQGINGLLSTKISKKLARTRTITHRQTRKGWMPLKLEREHTIRSKRCFNLSCAFNFSYSNEPKTSHMTAFIWLRLESDYSLFCHPRHVSELLLCFLFPTSDLIRASKWWCRPNKAAMIRL